MAVYMYKKFGSRQLISILSSLGFSSTYNDATLFELSTIVRREISIDQDAFCQFIFDNADFNVNTLDGFGTFHAMGGIQCVTPQTAVAADQNITRLQRLSSAQVLGKFAPVPLKSFQKRKNSGLGTIIIKDLDIIRPLSNEIIPSSYDLLWLFGKYSNIPTLPGWNGFMAKLTCALPYAQSKILCLPFINSPPSHYHTIFTSLLMATEKCKTVNQSHCFVTFDQPLYIKARDIISNSFSNAVIRLGGFHLLMSFMGSVGYIMAGSGLKELFTIIYAENSAEKILCGRAYSRAVRAHILAHLALSCILLQTTEFTETERTTIVISSVVSTHL